MKGFVLIIVMLTVCFSCADKQVPGIRTYELSPSIVLLDKYNAVRSKDVLARFFQGKTVYIDRWATWCTPCLEEFKYGDTLHTFLRENNIEMVYLNSDADIQDTVLYQFIISHHLTGYHLRLNDSLKTDLINSKVFVPLIPQFMIMDKEGNIVENRALRPSMRDSLFAQLRKYNDY